MLLIHAIFYESGRWFWCDMISYDMMWYVRKMTHTNVKLSATCKCSAALLIIEKCFKQVLRVEYLKLNVYKRRLSWIPIVYVVIGNHKKQWWIVIKIILYLRVLWVYLGMKWVLDLVWILRLLVVMERQILTVLNTRFIVVFTSICRISEGVLWV
jgi:hypothetical protein